MSKVSEAAKADELVLEDCVGQVVKLPLDMIIRNPDNPRTVFNKTTIALMAITIKEEGDVEDPISVRPAEDGKAILIDGGRRFQAAQEVELPEISCFVKPVMSDEDAFVKAVIANFNREDMSIVDKANAIQKIIDDRCLSNSEVARIIGLSYPTVLNILRVFKLHPDIQESLRNNKIRPGIALKLVSFPMDSQLVLLSHLEETEKARKEEEGEGSLIHPNDAALILQMRAEKLGIKPVSKKKKKKNFTSAEMVMNRILKALKTVERGLDDLMDISQVRIRETVDPPVNEFLGDFDRMIRIMEIRGKDVRNVL